MALTNAQRLAKLVKAEGELKQTQAGHVDAPNGPHWRVAMPLLWEVRQSLGTTPDGLDLAVAHGLLKDTEKGYDPYAPRWKKAMALIDKVEAHLSPPPVPNLGPLKNGGKSLLLHVLTHDTDGFDGVWPALDDTNVRVGQSVIAPESCRVIDHTGSDGGVGFKVRGASGIIHLALHQASRPPLGAVFLKGEKLSSVARIRPDQGGPHIHWALDTRPLVGQWLLYGGQRRPTDVPRDYTYGSPTIGVQLAKLLAT